MTDRTLTDDEKKMLLTMPVRLTYAAAERILNKMRYSEGLRPLHNGAVRRYANTDEYRTKARRQHQRMPTAKEDLAMVEEFREKNRRRLRRRKRKRPASNETGL